MLNKTKAETLKGKYIFFLIPAYKKPTQLQKKLNILHQMLKKLI